MTNLLISHKKQLLLAAVICLFSILTISSGKILSNFLDTKNRINKEKQTWINISQNIKSDLMQPQQKKWADFAKNNPEIFLRANTTNFLKGNDIQPNLDTKSIRTDTSKNLLANIVVTTKAHIKRVVQH